MASITAKILSINRNNINAYFKELRIKISDNSIKKHNKEFGEFELDESHLGERRVCAKRGRGISKKPICRIVQRRL